MNANSERISEALQYIPAHDRETWVNMGMAVKSGLGEDGFPIWEEWSRGDDSFDPKDAATAWKSFRCDGGITIGTLIHEAKANGWNEPTNGRQNLARKPPSRAAPSEQIMLQSSGSSGNLKALELWDSCQPASVMHPYVVAKHGRPDGLRVVPEDSGLVIAGQAVAEWLVVPVRSLDGILCTLQLIPPPGTGKKLNIPGATFDHGMFVVGDIGRSARIFIVEGVGQAWACWQASGCAAVVCCGAGRMATVASILRTRFDAKPMVLVPDRGKEVQVSEIARAICGEWVELPVDKAANYDANDFAAEYGVGELALLLDQTRTPEWRFRVLAADDLLTAPPLRWLVRKVVPATGLACIYGASGSGKSFLALDMCAAVANGAEWFGHRVTASPVVYIALEGEHGFQQRVNAWQVHHGHDIPKGLRFVMQPFDLRAPIDLAELAESVKASGGVGGLLVIDTLNRAASGADENSSKDMGEIIDAAKRLQDQLGGTVLLIHHSGKDQSKGLRGHSSLHAALDAAMEVTRNSDRREWRVAKSKDDGDGDTYPFRLEVVDIGTDEDGDPITSCAVVPDTGVTQIRKLLPPKSGNQKVIWDALGELLRMTGDARPVDAPERLPLGRPVVTLNSAIERARERLACDPKRKTERTQQALTGLHARGLVVIDGGYVWVA